MRNVLLSALPLVLLLTVPLNAQEALQDPPLYAQDPFDQITVDEASGGGTYRVLPIDFPQRKVPLNPQPSDVLTVTILDRDAAQIPAQIAWRNIAKVELFEQLVLAEAQRLTGQQRFDEAYDHLAMLHANYPQLAGLAAATRDFRFRNAAALFHQQRYTEALALLEEVYREEPQRAGLATALASVSRPLFDDLIQTNRYVAARQLVARTRQRTDDASQKLADAWQTELIAAARERQQLAASHFTAARFREANAAARAMLEIWPELPGGAELAQRAFQRWPLVQVGVGQLQPLAAGAVLQRAKLRTSGLAPPPLVLLSRIGPDGPLFDSPYGEVSAADNRRSIRIQLAPASNEPLTGYEVSQWLMQSCHRRSSSYDRIWAAQVKSVSVADVFRVDIELHRPHPQPLALLTSMAPLAIEGDTSPSTQQGYRPFERTETQAAYLSAVDPLHNSAGPCEVIESLVASPGDALADLRRGRLDVIERISPADVSALAEDAEIRVGRYALPSVHVLVPNRQRTYPASRTFRRAVAYGLARETILRRELLSGAEVEGCQTISGPLARSDSGETWGAAYNREIEPLAYEPRMALTLLRVADDEIARAAQQRGDAATPRKAIVLGHGPDWLHRHACQAIAEQLSAIGVACVAREISVSDAAAAESCDFWYVEWTISQPMVDIPRLLAGDELAAGSPYVALAVSDVAAATSLQQAMERLQAVHAAVHADQTIIPLWQLTDHYAFRANLTGVAPVSIGLYDSIRQWRFAQGRPVARSER
jgi:hypothetical protein